MGELTELRDVCAEAVRRGGAVLRERWGKERTIEYKRRPMPGRGDARDEGLSIDLVTDADKASEAALLGFLRDRFPGTAILAEESGASGSSGAPLRWFVDPLDGTTNYAHGLPHFAVTVAVEDGSGLAAGATYDPVRDELYLAARGEGATLNGVSLGVSRRDSLERSLLCTGFPYDIHQDFDLPLRLFGAFMVRARAVRRMGSAALDLAYVAAGRFDGFWEMKLKPWDVATGILLVAEAGGGVTDFEGGARMLHGGEICASNGILQEKLLAVIADTRRARS